MTRMDIKYYLLDGLTSIPIKRHKMMKEDTSFSTATATKRCSDIFVSAWQGRL